LRCVRPKFLVEKSKENLTDQGLKNKPNVGCMATNATA
jgi:hypothetical protein